MKAWRERGQKKLKQQSALDFMISYGAAIVIIAIAMYVVIRLGVFSSNITQPTCTTVPSFSCGDLAYDSNGLVTFVLTQATGGAINITGMACGTAINSSGNGPQYGNVHVLSYAVAPQYYPTSQIGNGIVMYSGTTQTFQLNCYTGGGIAGPAYVPAVASVGNPVIGYIWLNYSLGNLPPGTHAIQEVIQFTTKAA